MITLEQAYAKLNEIMGKTDAELPSAEKQRQLLNISKELSADITGDRNHSLI